MCNSGLYNIAMFVTERWTIRPKLDMSSMNTLMRKKQKWIISIPTSKWEADNWNIAQTIFNFLENTLEWATTKFNVIDTKGKVAFKTLAS